MDSNVDNGAGLRAFARALRQGEAHQARPVEIEALLIWLTRGKKRAPCLTGELGNAGDDTHVLERSFALLDRTLFNAGALSPAAAGVGNGVPESERRARYRQLITAFHPDRFPQLSAWLTPRSQAIHQAYAHFKKHRGEARSDVAGGPASAANGAANGVGVRGRGEEPWGAASYGRAPGVLERLRRRFGRSRMMPQKILLTVLLLALIPVLLLYLSQMQSEPAPAEVSQTLEETAPVQSAPPESLTWVVPAFTGAGRPDEVAQTDTFPFPDMFPLRLRGRVRWEFGQSVDMIEGIYDTSRAIIVPMLVALGAVERDIDTADLPPRFMLSGFLTQYIEAIEAQNLDALMRLLSEMPSQDENQGRVWFREHYAALFYQAKAIDYSLTVTEAERRGDRWLLGAVFDLKILYQSLDSETRRGRVQFTIVPRSGDWRIAAIDY